MVDPELDDFRPGIGCGVDHLPGHVKRTAMVDADFGNDKRGMFGAGFEASNLPKYLSSSQRIAQDPLISIMALEMGRPWVASVNVL